MNKNKEEFVNIGIIRKMEVENELLSIRVFEEIEIKKLCFIFIDISGTKIPFKIKKIIENKKNFDFVIKYIDLLKNIKILGKTVCIEKKIFDRICKDVNE